MHMLELPWSDIKEFSFNKLKDEKTRNLDDLKESILQNNFSMPFFAWVAPNKVTFVIDGTGRKLAIEMLEAEGHDIGELPVIFIEAKNIQEAQTLVLAVSSRYGQVTESSWLDFTENMDFNALNIDYVHLDGFDPAVLLEDLPEPEEKPKKAKTKFTTVCPECGHEFQK